MKDFLKGVVYAGIFAVPFVVLIVAESMFFPFITGKNFTFRIIVEMMFVAWVVLMLLDAQYRPRFSWIAAGGLGLIAVMLIANLLGEYPPKSFMSNFERMEGYITLVHFYLYFVIVGTMLTVEKHWNWFFNTTLGVALLVTFYAFAQISGAASVAQGGWRVDSTLGNSTYMAVYMLFHIFIAAFMLVRTRVYGLRYFYGAIIALFVFILLQTGTRGATLGLIGGGLLTTLYIALFAHGYPALRKVAVGGLVALALLVGGFVAVRDAAFIQNTPVLDRLADITLEEGSVRFMVWGVALEGIQDRPILGWGQGNFNYVFNQYYDPGLWRAEPWYDRVHNIVLDWLIAGGVIGAFMYFSILAAALFYTVVRPLWRRYRRGDTDETFSVAERGILLGLLAAYTFHNLFVFDNVVSYIFFAVILAYIHSRVATELPAIQRPTFDRDVVTVVIAPLVGVLLIAVVYFLHVPAIMAAKDIISAFRANTYDERFELLEQAWERNTFGDQEIAEQVSEQAMGLAAARDIAAAEKEDHLAFAEAAMLDMIERKPGDARFHLFLAGLYRAEGRLDEAAAELARTRELTPQKVSVILEQGVLELLRNDFAAMSEYFTTAYELAPEYDRAVVFYAIALIMDGETDRLDEVLTEKTLIPFASNEVVRVAAAMSQNLETIDAFFEEYLRTHPESTIARTAYAQWLYGRGEDRAATTVLDAAAEAIPSYADTADCYIENIEEEEEMRAEC